MPQDRPLSSAPPASKPASRDWGQAGWGDVLLHGLSTAPEAFGSDVAGTVKGLASGAYHGARQVAGIEPTAPGFERAVVSGVRGMAGLPLYTAGQGHYTPPTVADAAVIPHQALQAARGVGSYVAGRYGSIPNLKRTLATDMPGVAMDVGAVASIPEGGEGFLGKGAGMVANPVGRVVRTVRGGPILDKAGAFTPKVVAAMEEAAPGSARELANPTFRDHVIQTMGAKGISTPAAREAIISYHTPGMPVPRAPTLGVKPPAAAKEVSDQLVANSKNAIGANMKAAGLARDTPALFDRDTRLPLAPTRDIREYTLSPEGAGVFSPQDASDVRLATHAHDILGAELQADTKARWGPAALATAGAMGSAGVGALIGHASGLPIHGILPEVVGAGLGALGLPVEAKLAKPLIEAGQKQVQRIGAPGALLQGVAPLADAGAGVAHLTPVFNPHSGEQQAAPAAAPTPVTPTYTPFTPTPLEDEPSEPAPAATAAPAPEHRVHDRALSDDPSGSTYKPFTAAPLEDEPAPQADGGRAAYAAGGQVVDLAESLLKRAGQAQKAAQSATKPLLGLSDNAVAQALRAAQRGL